MPPFLRETFPVGLLSCNCTLLADPATGEAMILDPGLPQAEDAPGSPAQLMARLSSLGLRLKQIVVTHAHIDHVGGALALKQASGAPILFHQADLPLIAMMEMQAGWLGIAPPAVAGPDESADDGMRVGLATLPGEVLFTPGHTPGSICVLFPSAHLLVAGDTLFAGSIGRTDLPGGDSARLLASIRDRLLPLPEDLLVIPGHGKLTTIGQERERNPFLQGRS